METQEKTTAEPALQILSPSVPPWHDPEELRDRLNQPKLTYEEALAQTRRIMSQQNSGVPAPTLKNAN